MFVRKLVTATVLSLFTFIFFYFKSSNFDYLLLLAIFFSTFFIFIYGIPMSLLSDKLSKENAWLSFIYHGISGFIFPVIILVLSGNFYSLTKPNIHPAMFFSIYFWAIDQGIKKLSK